MYLVYPLIYASVIAYKIFIFSRQFEGTSSIAVTIIGTFISSNI